MRRVVPDATLHAMRSIGDPRLEDLGEDGDAPIGLAPGDENARKYFETVASDGLDAALERSAHADHVKEIVAEDIAEAVDALEKYGEKPAALVDQARGLFTYYGDEICASLLLAGLPDSYATAWGSRVLIEHGDLVWALPRRVRQTAMFLMTVFANESHGEQDKYGTETLERACAGLRLFHHMVRTQLVGNEHALLALGPDNSTPINQEDLLGTLLTFTVTTFGVLDQFGVNWSDDERTAYLLFWDLVGAALGIGTQRVRTRLRDKEAQGVPNPIRPLSVDEATRLLDQLHDRQWLPMLDTNEGSRPFPWSAVAPGRMLADALLNALGDAMPALRRTWPAIVMRELAPEIVRQRLGLNGRGISSFASRWVSHRSRYVQVARSATLRMMANDVTRHAMESFLRADGPPFVIPGLDLREITASNGVLRPTLALRSNDPAAPAP